MALLEDINRLLRDHTGYTGDGQGGNGALPVGDRSTTRWFPDMRTWREILKAMAQSMGDPSALQEILTDLAGKADLTSSGKMFGNRAEAVSAGQSNLPAAVGRIITVEGNYLVYRNAWSETDDPLFSTMPYWGVLRRVPTDVLLDSKADIANSGKFFGSRAQAVAAGQAALPASLNKIITREGTSSAPVLVLRTPGSADGEDPLFSTPPHWIVDTRIDPNEYKAPVASLELSRRKVRTVAGITPLMLAGPKVMMWAKEGEGIKGPGLGGAGGSEMTLVRAYAEPRRSPRASNLPIMTDGRSLHRLRGAMGKLKAGVAGTRPRIALVGDSWMELNPIPVALRDSLAVDYPMGGWGFWAAVGTNGRTSNPGAGYARSSGWTSMDASSGASLIYGAGPDGNLITTTLATETLALQNVILTELRIYTLQWGGTWRYRVDGGAWTIVSEPNSGGALRITTISGLTDAAHTIEIDTIGNTGRVAFACFLLGRGASGVEVLRMGNGGVRGIHLTETAPSIAAIGADLAPDVVIVSLGTNDYRYGDGVSAYIKGLRDLRNSWRTAVSGVGFVFISPALSGGTVVLPQADLRNALYEFCLTEGHEFYNMTDDWPAYAVSNAQGLWDDSLHPGAAGAHAVVGRLRQLMGV